MTKPYYVFDFDGTLVLEDTTKHLIFSLMKRRPLKVLGASYFILRMRLAKSKEILQYYKNSCIGYLIKGFSESDLMFLNEGFKSKVNSIMRVELNCELKEILDSRHNVIVASASPDFVLKCIYGDVTGIKLLGTRFDQVSGVFTGRLFGSACYGESKSTIVREFMNSESTEARIHTMWSDSEEDLPLMNLAMNKVWVD